MARSRRAASVRAIPPLQSFDQFRDLVALYRLPRVLMTALDFDLFTIMGTRSWTIPSLARRLKVSVRGLDILCRNLASAGVLEKRGSVYRNGRIAATNLNATHRDYRGGYVKLIRDHWDDWGKLTDSVKMGRPLDDDMPDDPAYRREFTWAMHHRSMDVAPGVAAQVDLHRARTLLDLGGGPGTYALAFLGKNPRLEATVADRAPALEVSREIAGRVKHGRRLSYLPLDFIKDDIPGRYDVIWYSNVLHIYSVEENRRIFEKVAAALNPGGRFLIQDAFLLDPDGTYPQETNLFAVTMLLFTEGGNTYSLEETARWLRGAGFGRVRSIPLKKGTGDWEEGLLEATKSDRRRGSRSLRSRSARR